MPNAKQTESSAGRGLLPACACMLACIPGILNCLRLLNILLLMNILLFRVGWVGKKKPAYVNSDVAGMLAAAAGEAAAAALLHLTRRLGSVMVHERINSCCLLPPGASQSKGPRLGARESEWSASARRASNVHRGDRLILCTPQLKY
jgi:hypothetical protein